jgi:aspartate-semialdehyde dehydrogenase
MTEGLRVAVVGASGLVGEALIEVLAEGGLAIAVLHALASDRSLGQAAQFRGRSVPLGVLAGFDFGTVDLALFAVDAVTAGEHVPRALAAGCRVIDASDRFHEEPGVPLLLPGVIELPPEAQSARLVTLPGPAAAALATVLAPLHRWAGLARVDIVVLEAASAAGRAGVEELVQQSALLMNGRPVTRPQVFSRQIAFNCVPEVGNTVPGQPSSEELAVISQLKRLLTLPELAVGVTAVAVPVFFGHSAAVHLRLARNLDADRARTVLRKARGVRVVDEGRGARFPTAATEAVDSADVLVGRIRDDASRERGLALWVVADNVRAAAANQLARTAEILVNGGV